MCKRKWEFFQIDTTLIYVCFTCGEIIPCRRDVDYEYFSHLIASKDENGKLVVKDRAVA
jgi:hypothetical protein